MATRTIYEVKAEHMDGRVSHVTATETAEEAQEKLGKHAARVEAAGGHNKRYWVQPKDVSVDFVVPDKGLPKDRYWISVEKIDNGPGHWASNRVTVHESIPGDRVIGEYTRDYAMLQTFHPFRQYQDGVWRDYALIAPDYTRTSVMDLSTGEIVADEPWPVAADDFIGSDGTVHWRKGDEQPGAGFCPVEFYVPDWWEIHDGSIISGSEFWGGREERPTGEFGFVAGCHWGDDSSWKIRYVDLSGIAEGRLTVDERFGYIELPSRVRLSDAVSYLPGSDAFDIAVTCNYRHDGKQTGGPGSPEED